MFCDKNFSGCSTSRAAAHLLARPVMGQDKAGVKPCIAINKKDDDRRGALRNAQRAIGKVIRDKEQSVAGKKRKQQVMDDLITSPTKQSVESSLIGSQKSGTNEVDAMITNEVDAMIASFFYENGISFNVANSSSFGRMIAESMKFAKQNRWWECVCSLKSFLRPRASETGLLTGTSTPRSVTGLSLQPLRSLYTFTQIAKWWQRLVMPTSSRCLLGIMKMFKPRRRVTASDHVACNSLPCTAGAHVSGP